MKTIAIIGTLDTKGREFGFIKQLAEERGLKTFCINTGVYYGDVSQVLCVQGYLHDEYADGSGRALNNAGLRELLNYLRDHSVVSK